MHDHFQRIGAIIMSRLGEPPQLFQKTRSVLDGKSFGTAYILTTNK